MIAAITVYALVAVLVVALELSHAEADEREISGIETLAIASRAALWLPMAIAALAALAIDAAATRRR